MKRTIKFLSAITLLFLIVAACNQETTRTDTREDLADLREGMKEVIQDIDEALAEEDISDFISKTDDALSSLDNKIDDYLDEMDNAERRIDNMSRNHVIEMKQKKVEVEFKLALLEQDDYDNWGDENYQRDRTDAGTGTHMGDDRTAAGQTTAGNMNRRTGTDRREIKYGPQLVNDLKADLRDLRGKVNQFTQSSLPPKQR